MIKGMQNPNVIIQYFDITKMSENIDTNYLIGYSMHEPFIIINRNAVNIMDSTNNFEAAMNIYLNAVEDCASNKYIFTKTTQSIRRQQYFIGTRKSNICDTLISN